MKRFLVCFFLFLCATDAHAQLFPRIFRPRDRSYPVCPGPDCPDSVSPGGGHHPGLAPVAPSPVDDSVLAEYEQVIPPALRIKNQGPNCGWCALEDVMVAAGYEQFKGMRERAYQKGWHGNTFSDVMSAVKESGVEVKTTESRDYGIFEYAKSQGVGVYVQIPGHALVCLGVDDRYAYMLDNNGDLKVQRWPRDKFNRLWDGVGCCPKIKLPKIFPPKKPKDDPKPEVKPAPDTKPCNCDQKSVAEALTKLADVATLTNKSVGELSAKMGTLDQRMTAVEGKLAGEKPPATPPSPSTAVPDERLKKIQDDLDKLKKNLNGEATLRVTVTPR